MNGIILYADDDVLTINSTENALFQKFNNSSEYSVLPITNLVDLEKTISCISTFRALLLDWSFKKPTIDEDMPEQNENPLECLKQNKIYSLVYIYSRELLDDTTKNELKEIFGNKIVFKQKSIDGIDGVDQEFNRICNDLSHFERDNQHMEIPFIWSQSINKSVQTIFTELEQASTNWIHEIITTASSEQVDPCSEVINIFHNILYESLILNKDLHNSLRTNCSSTAGTSQKSTAKLYRRLLYTKLAEDTPPMTGEIYKFNDNEYGILITPECEMRDRKDNNLDFIVFSKENFTPLLTTHGYTKGTQLQDTNKDRQKKSNLLKIFNNYDSSIHVLPSFPFDNNNYDETACINFKTAFTIKEKSSFEKRSLHYKLNSPYIHQLRQRYIAFYGRYGVPTIPDSLKKYNLGIQDQY